MKTELHASRLMITTGAVLALLVLAQPGQAQITGTFDFDSGTPPLTTTTTPFSYTDIFSGITATFSSPTANAFSVQPTSSVSGVSTLPGFSGNFLNPNSTARATLDIRFDVSLTDLSFAFATAQSSAVEIPNPISLSAFLNTTANPVGSPVTVSGSFNNLAMPSGTLTFSTDQAHPFNLVEIVMQPGGAGGILADNINVTAVPEPSAYAFAASLALLTFAAWREYKKRQPSTTGR